MRNKKPLGIGALFQVLAIGRGVVAAIGDADTIAGLSKPDSLTRSVLNALLSGPAWTLWVVLSVVGLVLIAWSMEWWPFRKAEVVPAKASDSRRDTASASGGYVAQGGSHIVVNNYGEPDRRRTRGLATYLHENTKPEKMPSEWVPMRQAVAFWADGEWPAKDKILSLHQWENGVWPLAPSYSDAADELRAPMRRGDIRAEGWHSSDKSRALMPIDKDTWATLFVDKQTLTMPDSTTITSMFRDGQMGVVDPIFDIHLHREDVIKARARAKS